MFPSTTSQVEERATSTPLTVAVAWGMFLELFTIGDGYGRELIERMLLVRLFVSSNQVIEE